MWHLWVTPFVNVLVSWEKAVLCKYPILGIGWNLKFHVLKMYPFIWSLCYNKLHLFYFFPTICPWPRSLESISHCTKDTYSCIFFNQINIYRDNIYGVLTMCKSLVIPSMCVCAHTPHTHTHTQWALVFIHPTFFQWEVTKFLIHAQ